jgi:hypothetical protein
VQPLELVLELDVDAALEPELDVELELELLELELELGLEVELEMAVLPPPVPGLPPVAALLAAEGRSPPVLVAPVPPGPSNLPTNSVQRRLAIESTRAGSTHPRRGRLLIGGSPSRRTRLLQGS